MDHEELATLFSDISARPTAEQWALAEQHTGSCDRCLCGAAGLTEVMMGELALLRFEKAGGRGPWYGAGRFWMLGLPLLLLLLLTTMLTFRAGDEATVDPTPSAMATSTATATATETSTPSSTPTASATPEPAATSTPPPVVQVEPPTQVPTAPLPPPVGSDPPMGVCSTFWSRQQTSGRGFNQEYEDTLVALENAERREVGRGNLILDSALRSVGAMYARTLLETGWWSQADDLHTGPDGRYFTDRLKASGVSYRYASENVVVGLQFQTPCDSFYDLAGYHRQNYLGESLIEAGVIYEPLYSGVACYMDYGEKVAVCVQYFIAR